MTLTALETNRLRLRQLKESDVNAIYSLRSNEQVNRFIARSPAKNPEEARGFIAKILENKSFYWGIALKETDELIGTICFWNESADGKSAEVGYELQPDYQGKGYMDEAMGAVLGFAFESGMTCVEAHTHEENVGSTKLLLKHGFVLEAERKDPEFPSGLIFSLAKPAPDPGGARDR